MYKNNTYNQCQTTMQQVWHVVPAMFLRCELLSWSRWEVPSLVPMTTCPESQETDQDHLDKLPPQSAPTQHSGNAQQRTLHMDTAWSRTLCSHILSGVLQKLRINAAINHLKIVTIKKLIRLMNNDWWLCLTASVIAVSWVTERQPFYTQTHIILDNNQGLAFNWS